LNQTTRRAYDSWRLPPNMSGQLVEQWPVIPLGELCQIKTGRKDANQGSPNGKYPFFTCAKEHIWSEEYSFEGEALLIAGNGDVGNTTYYDGKFEAYQRTYVLMDFKGVSANFLFYALGDRLKAALVDKKLGSTMPYIKKGMLSNFPITVPPMQEQQRIVNILDEAFETLDEKSQQIHSRLNGAEDLFGSYLSDLFSKKHQGWEEMKVGEVVTLQGGSQPPKAVFSAEYLEGYIRLIQIRDYKSDKHIVYIPKEKARRFCTKDDIMIGRYGPPLFQILRGIEGAYNVALMKAIPDEQYLTKDFLYYFLQNRDLLRYIERSSSRTAGQTGFKKETLESYTITYPKSKEQQLQLVEKLDTLKEKITNIIVNYEREIHMVEELKQSILQEAFNGTLRIAEGLADQS
jgi:type I restriction enzyme, S subunit